MALTKTTKIEAINTMLSVLGEAPINTLSGEKTPDVSIAEQTLDEVSRDVQGRGWHFNTETNYTLTPNSLTGKISIPANALRIDVKPINSGYNVDIVQRGEFLYDKKAHSFVFGAAVLADIVFAFEWDEIPEDARRYIMIRAARIFQDRTLGSEKLSAFSAVDEQRALVDLQETEGDTSDRTIFDNPTIGNIVNRRSILGRIS